jgi:8-amino-7-oxononanoate synthase
MFTTALPPATLAAALAALEIAEAEPERAERALAHARRFCEALGLPAPESQIVPILFGEAAAALEAMQQLQNQGLLVTAIRPPTVPKGTARLRVSFSAAHTDAQVEALIAALRPLLAPAPERRHG